MNLPSTADKIRAALTVAFTPIHLEVTDESALHAGHAGARPGGETHFRVKIISAKFTGMGRVEQHRAVYSVLADHMKRGIHALALETSND